MDPVSLTDALVGEARRLGFALAGVAPAVRPPGLRRLGQWRAAGCAASMGHFAARAGAYAHPRHVLPGVRSILMLGLPYRTVEPEPTAPGQGRIARFAWGADYHGLIREKLRELVRLHRRLVPEARARGGVDTAPLSERTFGQMAALGWIGRNTTLIHPELGSWFFLAALLSTAQLEVTVESGEREAESGEWKAEENAGGLPGARAVGKDLPRQENRCGTCRACLAACPTGALREDGLVDARRCLSYLTIEHDGPIPRELRPKLADRLLGCDACQEACPWNRGLSGGPTAERALFPSNGAGVIDLGELLALDDAGFEARYGHTVLAHAGRARVLRNAAIVLGNRPAPGAMSLLVDRLGDPAPQVRGAAAWALGRYAARPARQALAARASAEQDPEVRCEIETALSSGQ